MERYRSGRSARTIRMTPAPNSAKSSARACRKSPVSRLREPGVLAAAAGCEHSRLFVTIIFRHLVFPHLTALRV